SYNAAQSEIDKNHGQGTGALKGESILGTLSNSLRSIAQYNTGGSGISSLTSLGLSFDKNGVLSFDATAFQTATSGSLQALTDFLGSPSTGGFPKAATDTLNAVTDADTGILSADQTSIQSQITRTNQSISDTQDRVDTLQANLQAQMAAADAAIAALEQQ